MSVPVLTFFNNKGGVGKTSLIYHLAWIFADQERMVLACDLDPQANLSSMFVDDERLAKLWPEHGERKTISGAFSPLLQGIGDVHQPHVEKINEHLHLVVGDLNLSTVEDDLSSQWPLCLDGKERAFRVTSAIWRVLQKAAVKCKAELILADVGPNLGALNRVVLVASDCVVVPLGADLFSLQGLRNLGPALHEWRTGWKERTARNPTDKLALPAGTIKPIGYVIQQHSTRLNRPTKFYDQWVNRMPAEYLSSVLRKKTTAPPATPLEDSDNCLATVKHYRSLVPMAQEARKPIFHLKTADGAFGTHAAAAQMARRDFKALAKKITERIPL